MYENDNYSGLGSGEQVKSELSGAQSSVTPYFNSLQGANTESTAETNSFENSIQSSSAQSNNMNVGSSMGTSGENASPYSHYNTYQMSGGMEDRASAEGSFAEKETFRGERTFGEEAYREAPYKEVKSQEMHSQQAKPLKEKKSAGFFQKAILAVSLGLCFGLFAGLGFIAVQQGTGLLTQQEEEQTMGEIQNTPVIEETQSGIKLNNTNNVTVVRSDISEVVDDVMPAMVSIVNNYTESTQFWGQTYTQQAASSGSGIIVAENETELLIVSNNHVVVDSDQLMVTFIDGSEAEAHIKGLDSDMDLAVIAVELEELSEETKKAISVAALGNSDDLKLGEPVIAIGNALGYGQSVTTGIVSALDREITMDDGSTGVFIQTDAAINPGNSGGALLNVNGEVVGINSNKIGGTAIEGMGYAIPITSASPIIADLMERQTRNKVDESDMGYMGISMQEITDQYSLMFNMPQGVYVVETVEGSAAQAAGLMSGDIITEFDGNHIDSYADLQSVLQYYAAGDSAVVTVQRPENGQYVEYELQITLGERPKENR